MEHQEDKLAVTEKYFTLINRTNVALFGILRKHLSDVRQIMPIVEFIIERLTAVTELTLNGNLWDAEIVLRSAQETLLKLVFITSADKVEQEIRFREFWNDLAEINSLKQSEQAKKNLKYLGIHETHRLAFTPLILSDEQELQIRTKWTKAERQKIEQKWSFSQIIASLSKSYHGKPFGMLVTLAHTYRMASHVTHGDETGILIIRERNSRTQPEQDKANFAHYLRLLNDTYTYCRLIAIEVILYLELDKSLLPNDSEDLGEIHQLTDKYHLDVFDDEVYDRYRNR